MLSAIKVQFFFLASCEYLFINYTAAAFTGFSLLPRSFKTLQVCFHKTYLAGFHAFDNVIYGMYLSWSSTFSLTAAVKPVDQRYLFEVEIILWLQKMQLLLLVFGRAHQQIVEHMEVSAGEAIFTSTFPMTQRFYWAMVDIRFLVQTGEWCEHDYCQKRFSKNCTCLNLVFYLSLIYTSHSYLWSPRGIFPVGTFQ